MKEPSARQRANIVACVMAILLTSGCEEISELTNRKDSPSLKYARVPNRETKLSTVVGVRDKYVATFGAKDVNGVPSSSSDDAVYVLPDGEWVHMTFGSDGFPSRLKASDGYVVDFVNTTKQTFQVQLIDPNGNLLATDTMNKSNVAVNHTRIRVYGHDISGAAKWIKAGVAIGATLAAVASSPSGAGPYVFGAIALGAWGEVLSDVADTTQNDIDELLS